MTEEEYIKRKEELAKEFDEKKEKLNREFVLSNTDVKVGDIVSDGHHTIKVDKIIIEAPYFGCSVPSASYKGVRLTKQLKPFKSGESGCIWNVKNHIKQ